MTDDHAAQDRVLSELTRRSDDPEDIRAALTADAVPATDRRARFVGLPDYELAGGTFRRDLFAEGDDGVFLLDSVLLDRLALDKLQAHADVLSAEGWKWVEPVLDLDYEARGEFRTRRPEPLPLSEEAAAEQRALSEEYDRIYGSLEEDDEEACERLDAIETRIAELEQGTAYAYTPEVLAIAGAIVTIGHDGEPEVLRGLVRPGDEPEDERPDTRREPKKERAEYSAALVESLTEAKSAGIAATLAGQPHVALAAVVHALAGSIFCLHAGGSSLQLTARLTPLRGESKGVQALNEAHERWAEQLPGRSEDLWTWCIDQHEHTLLDLLAYCAARTVNAVQAKHDRPDGGRRIVHANALAAALSADMAQWFTPTAENFFSRVGRTTIVSAMAEAKGTPAKKSWGKLKKAEFAALAEREIAGTGWLPMPVRT